MYSDLTRREKDVLDFIILGYTNAKIAKKLNITSFTVKAHVQSILYKLHAQNRIQAAVIASTLSSTPLVQNFYCLLRNQYCIIIPPDAYQKIKTEQKDKIDIQQK